MEKIAIVFPGQGSQYIGMGKTLYDNFEIAKNTYEEASEAAGINIPKLCFQGTVSAQNKFTNMQIIIVTTAVAMYRSYFYEYSVIPQFLAGHSVGEYAAYVCSGALELSDAMKILQQRGKLLETVIDDEIGHMTIVENINYEQIENCFKQNEINEVYISCRNSAYQFAICGQEKEINHAEKSLKSIGANITPIFSSPPIHSPIIKKEIVDELHQYLSGVKMNSFSIPVITNFSSTCNCNETRVARDLAYQLTNPVDWVKITDEMDRYGVSILLEMGPKKLLCSFDDANNRDYHSYCYGVDEDRKLFNQIFQKSDCLKRDKTDFFGRCLKLAVSVKNRNYDSDDYNRQVVQNYNTLLSYEEKYFDEKTMVTVADILLDILKTKKAPKEEIVQGFHRVINETNSFYILGEWYKKQFVNI